LRKSIVADDSPHSNSESASIANAIRPRFTARKGLPHHNSSAAYSGILENGNMPAAMARDSRCCLREVLLELQVTDITGFYPLFLEDI
jgi:hypothetical protein